jgi:hypothetical protein
MFGDMLITCKNKVLSRLAVFNRSLKTLDLQMERADFTTSRPTGTHEVTT